MDDPTPRIILHVDLDAFFAAVEVREDPSLQGKPLVIGADPKEGRGRGVVSTASYEARRFGIHSAQPISRAYRLCPDAIFLPPRGDLYAAVSRRFMTILERFTDLVEPLSIDEAFLDVTASQRLFGDGRTIARRIQQEVQDEEGLSASIGVAPVKFVAKIASDLEKPNGLVCVEPDRVREFLRPLPVKRLFGAGPRALRRFADLGVVTLGELAEVPVDRLVAVFGETLGHHYHRLAHGRDSRPVEPDLKRKSLGREQTYLTDVLDRDKVRRTLLWLVEDVTAGLRRRGLCGRTVTVKLRTEDFATVTRRMTLPEPLDTTEAVWPVAQKLLQRADTTDLPIRLVGVSVSDFGAQQVGLFDSPTQATGQRMSRALDRVTRKFGKGAVVRGSLLSEPRPERDVTRPVKEQELEEE